MALETKRIPEKKVLKNESILIVDDELSIRKSLEGILGDEGFTTFTADDCHSALSALKLHKPDLVLLDIWMPGLDGIETLRMIKELYSDVPVIMMSGHATISTALEATRIGASDFIEKPLDLHSTLKSVNRVLAGSGQSRESRSSGAIKGHSSEAAELIIGKVRESLDIEPLVFRSQKQRGKAFPQKTIAQSALLYGQGLHSGKKSGLILEPLPVNSGIHFASVSAKIAVPAHVNYVTSTGFATTLRHSQTQIGTIEHLMSALCAYGITNLLIKCNDEVPVFDGSALEFCGLFEEVGLLEQEGEWYDIEIRETIKVEGRQESIQIEPADGLIIDYTLDYPDPLGKQRMVFSVDSPQEYKREIAPARTFGFVKDVGALQKQGLALGGRFDNFVLIGPEGPINDSLRFPDEAVRHKILDAIGDLYLLGRRLRGKVTARMTGHSDNIELLKKVGELL